MLAVATRGVADTARVVAESISARAADAVDREGRFPHESIAALRQERLLGAYVPTALGGRGATIAELAAACEVLGRACASSAMVFAMHQIEVACLVRHAQASTFFRDYLADVAQNGRLIASATSEIGVGGDLRRSLCAIEPDGGGIRVRKQAPVVSYGEETDDILLTARRAPDAAPSDQVLLLARRADLQLTRTSDWDALGMRGTRSVGFTIEAACAPDQVIPAPFADVANQTMLPVSHVLWTAIWLGLASDAVARARAFVRAEARKTPGIVPPVAHRLAEAVADLGTMGAVVHGGCDDFTRHQDDPETLSSVGFALRMNNLKASASRMAPEIVARALGVCGIAGYRNDSPFSVGRHLRDAYGAALMIHNDRVYAANASMLLVHKGE